MKFDHGFYAFVLDQSSYRALQIAHPPRYYKAFTHHVTVKFPVMTERQLNEAEGAVAGAKHQVVVTGLIFDDTEQVECFTVAVNGQTKRLDGGFYHLTHSIGEGKKPVASNRLLEILNGVPIVPLFVPIKGEFKLVKFGH